MRLSLLERIIQGLQVITLRFLPLSRSTRLGDCYLLPKISIFQEEKIDIEKPQKSPIQGTFTLYGYISHKA